MSDLETLAGLLNQLRPDPQARMGYDLFAGGLVWSDEVPAGEQSGLVNGEFPKNHEHFRALLHFRSSLILGTPKEAFRELWDRANQLCPNWPGFLPSRRDAALADTYRARSEASRRAWEELDARYEQQRKIKSSKAS